jgi:methyl-accepting chemotaxis protein
MKIQTRLQFSFGAILLMVLCVGIAGALTMRRTSASLSAALKDSFQVTTATEQLAALAHEHNVIVSMHAAAGSLPEPGRLEKIEKATEDALVRLEALDPASGASSRELVSTAQKKAKLLLMASAEEPELEPAFEPEPQEQPAPPPRRGKGKQRAQPAPPPAPEPRPARAAAPGAEGRIAALYAEAETFLAQQHAARRARIDAEIDKSGREAATRFMVLFGVLVAVGFLVTALVFSALRSRVLRPLQSLADLARRVSADRDLRATVKIGGDDEIRDLSLALAGLMETLRQITVDLRSATDRLLESARELGGATRSQSESVSRQATALEEARRTSGVLRESSRSVAQQVGGVLQVAEKAEALSRAGEGAMSAGLGGVQEVRRQTQQVAGGFAAVVDAVQQIGNITAVVKDLADQSNLLALNAALEASRAGAAGAGFAVVAREIRSLADRSIRATQQVRAVLGTLLKRVREGAELVESAQAGIEAGAGSTQLLGDSLGGLSTIVRENLTAAHRISGAIADQGSGIDQITSAVEDLARMMDETLRTVSITSEAAGVLHDVSGQVSEAVKAFRV